MSEENGHTILKIRDLDVWYKMPRGVARVVDKLALDVHYGKVLGIVGESGSGKTMMASAIMRVVPPPGHVEGKVTFDSGDGEVDILALRESELRKLRWKEIAMIFQGALNTYNPTLRIRSHFLDTASAHGLPKNEDALEKAESLLELVRLDPARTLKSYPHELSGGMKQRALIAMGLLLDPKLLILDEPTSALDLLMQKFIVDLLKDIQGKLGITMMFITHDLPLIAGLVDRVAVMYAFKIVEVASVYELFKEPKHPYTTGLLGAVPSLTAGLEDLKPVPGQHPDPINPPPGCGFHPRCWLADERCRKEEPQLLDIGNGHLVACHYWYKVK